MLSIRPIGSSRQQVAYYVNLGKEDYYVNGGEAPGRWFGSAIKALGLDGIVRGEQLRNLMRGYSVSGTAKLVQNAGQANRTAPGTTGCFADFSKRNVP